MNRRFRPPPATIRDHSYLRYLKPGALAQLRDSRIKTKSHLADSQAQICLYRTTSQPTTPTQTASFDALPCFISRIYSPRCPQRKKLMAAKSAFFFNSGPTSPVNESSPDPIIDLFSNNTDFLVAH
ncbi:hypothetical protein RJ639_008162 [Escallonia herrerae]|uniref:Uncharacterized protein n=1 Tax=Escallonia herrerae TaxID=1293975 RepID=A0AA88VU82_9ASTE|nr:hypothetical protein RJ639_008162 [Escallonia herrerae]